MAYLQEGFKLINILESEGYKAFIIGGAVRDILLGLDIHDIDIATSATPEIIKRIFATRNTGEKYNSVTVLFNNYEFEVTTFRKDIAYLDNRHPEFEVTNTLEADVLRRDFTINALALDKDNKLIDLVAGKKDLDNKILKAIGDPNFRFKEDSLRILRAIYYANRLHFDIEENTKKALKEEAYLVQNLSFERIEQMLEKMINENIYLASFKLMKELLISSYLKPFNEAIELVINHNILDLNWLYFLALSFYKKEINYNFKEKKELLNIYELTNKNLVDPIVHYQNNLENILIAYKLQKLNNKLKYDENKLREVNDNLIIKNHKDLDINVEEIKALTNLDGANLGEIIDYLIFLVLNRKIANEYTILKKYCIKYAKKLKNNSK